MVKVMVMVTAMMMVTVAVAVTVTVMLMLMLMLIDADANDNDEDDEDEIENENDYDNHDDHNDDGSAGRPGGYGLANDLAPHRLLGLPSPSVCHLCTHLVALYSRGGAIAGERHLVHACVRQAGELGLQRVKGHEPGAARGSLTKRHGIGGGSLLRDP